MVKNENVKPKAVVAMSGGVDSSVAAWLMKERGYDCIGATMKLISGGQGLFSEAGSKRCCSLADVTDARNVAYNIGIPHYVFNFIEEFDAQVIRRFVESYWRGVTPNPCIDCNRYIKFKRLCRRALELGFDVMATGHYAGIERDGSTGRFLLKKAVDKNKDQSYFLYCLTQEELARACFPLGELTKDEVREIAAARGFFNAQKGESQDICFVPDGDYGAFIEDYTGKKSDPGDFVDAGGRVLGQHRGIMRYTIGQRRGLGLALAKPVYVSAIRPETNTVVVSWDEELYSKTLEAADLNFIPFESLESPSRFTVKIRYRQREQAAVIHQTGQDRLLAEFDAPQRAVTPGQALVIYDGDFVIGGGTIAANSA